MIRYVPRGLPAAGAFVVSLDSVVNIAFPAIAAAFDAPPERMRGVIIAYVLTYALVSFVGGAAGDHVGHGRIFSAGLAVSTLGFVLCGAAPTLGGLVLGRIVQGLGGGLVYGTTPALTMLGVPPTARGRALGFLTAAIGFALAVGPLLAGVVVEHAGWRWIFHLRVPLALAVLVWALRAAPASGPRRPALGLRPRDLLRVPVLGAGVLAFLAQAGIFSIWLLAPFYLVERRGLGAGVGGVFFMLTPLGTALGAPLAGRLVDRVGPRVPLVTGLAVEAIALGVLSRAGPATAAPRLALALAAAGLGLGVFQVPNMTTVMAEFPLGQQGAAGGFAFLARTLGTVAGVALLAQVFGWRRAAAGFDSAYATAFLVAAALVVLAVALAVGPAGRARSA